MGKICKAIRRQCDTCTVNDCEVELFLRDFVKYICNVNIYDLNFRCPDKEKEAKSKSLKKTDLEFKIGTKSYAIEAKGLDNTYLCRMQHASRCISNSIVEILENADLFRSILGEDTQEFEILFQKYGVGIQFYEDILFATNILGKDTCRKIELIKDILTCVLKTLRNTNSSIQEFDKDILAIGVYSLDKRKYHKKTNKAKEIEQLSLMYKKRKRKQVISKQFVFPPYHLFTSIANKGVLWYKLAETKNSAYNNICNLDERITFSVQTTRKSGEFTTGITYDTLLIEDYEILNSYWSDKIDNTEKKMSKYNSSTKRILFINNEGNRLIYNSDMYKNIIRIIKENVKRCQHIDEVWLEYYKSECYEDRVDFLMVEDTQEKVYEKIWTKR